MDSLPPKQRELLAYLQRFCAQQGLPPSRGDLADALGISRQTADQHLRALAGKGFIELMPGTSRGIRLLEQDAAAAAANDPYRLPLVGRIAAGQPVLAPAHIEDHLRVDPALFRPRADFLYQVHGRSMERAHILPGDLVGIHAQPRAEAGQIVAVAIEDRQTGEPTLTLKRYQRQGEVVSLLSENEDQERYAPIRIDLRQQRLDIVGIYAGLLRRPQEGRP
jgi:repressor LexA